MTACGNKFWISNTAKSPKGEQLKKGTVERAGMWISIGINNAGNNREWFCI